MYLLVMLQPGMEGGVRKCLWSKPHVQNACSLTMYLLVMLQPEMEGGVCLSRELLFVK
ncbi:hypothetical protein HOLleu_44577 [Holothuria leucospilota]|uniref:Uncharacterized protein n=1 Tax=Holothuria leucospilota TaxID=206669 RepID=A0A9Q0YAB9_HOLLE|nr:hypothetical protein HOLleu_44577 [Holothuria leucospilota]